MFHEERRGKNGIIHVYWKENGKGRSKAVGLDRDAVKEFKLNLANRLYRQKAGLIQKNVPLAQFFKEYINEYCYANKEPRTVVRDEITLKTFQDRMPFVKFVHQYDANALISYKGLRRKEAKKESTINRELGTLKNAMLFAVEKKYKEFSDAQKVAFFEVPRMARDRVLTDKELNTLLKTSLEPYHCAFMLGAYAGLRAGEACRLEIKDLDFERNIIRIRAKANWKPKNTPSVRDVPIHPILRTYLKTRLKASPGPFLCAFKDGRRLDEGVLSSTVFKTRKAFGIPDFCFHILRHTFVTRMGAAGADTYSISKMIGHSNTKVTESVYTHLKDSYYQDNIDMLRYKLK
jgi:integrase